MAGGQGWRQGTGGRGARGGWWAERGYQYRWSAHGGRRRHRI